MIKAIEEILLFECKICNFYEIFSLFTNNYYIDLTQKLEPFCIQWKEEIEKTENQSQIQ